MHMAANADEWLQLNTSYCHRLRAWVTAKTCEKNRLRSGLPSGDLRCNGCNGLSDQALPLDVTLSRSLQLALEEVLKSDTLPKEQVLDGEDVDNLEYGSIDEDELEAELAKLLPEYRVYLQSSETERRIRPAKTVKVKKVAVYLGRCQICGGYMVFAPERQFDERDDEVYRCYSCSWRTSPEYEWNRKQGL